MILYKAIGAIAILFCSEVSAQAMSTPLATDLMQYRVKGRQSPFKRNVSFAGYSSSMLSRTFGSIFYINNINLLNPIFVIEGIPLMRFERQKRKDVFNFDLNRDEAKIASVECRAFLRKNETFRLLKKQDSSFWGSKNTDVLMAVIHLNNDTGGQWNLLASNLNASKEDDQKGKIVSGREEISFSLTNAVLQESADKPKGKNVFATLNMVYAFYYKDKIIAAVSVKEAGRSFWIKENIKPEFKDVVAAASAILIIRKNLYQ